MIHLVLPWITKSLHAHNKGSFYAKIKPVRDARLTAKSVATRAILDGAIPIKKNASISYVFFVPNNARRDAGNMKQSCKPYVDGIVDSGLISGDHWQVLRDNGSSVVIDRDNPRVEVFLWSLESED